MKYSEGDKLYYVCPFTFIIERIKIDMGVVEEGIIHYIDSDGAWLNEVDLFKNFKEAQKDAITKLDKFYYEARYRILNHKPHFGG
jgi:hypothetical protein